MDFSKAGLILYTEKYPECVNFYGDILGLDLLFEINRPGEQLTCFEPCLSGYHPHPLYVVCTHFPE